MRKAILTVSFGTSCTNTLEKTIAAVEADIKAAFPEYTHKRAFTSTVIINKLKNEYGMHVNTVEEAFGKLSDFDEVIVAATHVMNGFEYKKLCRAAKEHGVTKITRPLISTDDDYNDFIREMAPLFADRDVQYVLMGHGTERCADSVYALLDCRLKEAGFENVHVGTVEGSPGPEQVMNRVRGAGKAVLMPMMLVAGSHAVKDMVSDWSIRLGNMGIKTECIIKGLGEYAEIRRIYVAHVADLL